MQHKLKTTTPKEAILLLALLLHTMKPGDEVYNLVRQEALKRGRWKNEPRGNNFAKGYDPRRAIPGGDNANN